MEQWLPGMVLALVLSSALVHALWNVLFAKVSRGPAAVAVANATGFLLWAPIALTRWRITAEAVPFLLFSAVFQAYYLVMLRRAYARAPAHTVYPVARGLGPVLVLAAAVATGARLPPAAVAAVALISAGVWLTATGEVDRRVVTWAVPVAIALAAYPLVASHGLRYAGPATYLWLSLAPITAGSVAASLIRARGFAELRAELRPATVATGVGMIVAGGLTMAALSMVEPSQVPAVAALRETGILFVAPLSWLTTGTFSRNAAGGAVLVFAGVALLALG
ncbi:hypothetical protein Ait01nite_014090 [Actinoplanes italicus]|nr:hypothetical protein [Actinoplanes italicus]GIE28364.1 hypothetical protein Ait01nite_014090 [Actinoplanes italicus]